ncbi:MAG: HAD-IIB family hydrolase [Anderseniella sp.]|nr:HAD-IIB family hydrolase [Anderseniella sp.]
MDQIYLFDVDGTLTEPRHPIDPDFGRFFGRFCRTHPVYLVSGSDLPKLQEQLPRSIIASANGVFSCSAAELWVDGKTIYQMDHEFPKELIEALESFVELSCYPRRFGNHIEYRTGMLNVSVVGRNAQKSDRQTYFAWDRQEEERAGFIKLFVETFSEYEASAGGEISIDIVPKGWNKSRALAVLKQDAPTGTITFFGDRMEPGGNDYPLAEALRNDSHRHRVMSVENFNETWDLLKTVRSPRNEILRQAS